MTRFLVTGGAGFVGSHLVLALRDRGAEVVVLDDLRTGHRAAIPPGVRLIEADLCDREAARAALQGGFEAVFHFAGLSLVGESMARPFAYLRENVLGGLNLIEAAVAAGVRKFVLSSSAAVFGPAARPIPPLAPPQPGSPYGSSKRMLEEALDWADRLHGLRSARLRYFNAAGADPAGRAGEDHRPETHLIPSAIDAALGRRGTLVLNGTDYPTPDGTCVRDYVHVSDLAAAHLQVLPLLATRSVTLNVGTGQGHSVRAVIEAVARVAGRRVPVTEGARRAGDPAVLVADPAALIAQTGWRPVHAALDAMVGTAFSWRVAHPQGYGPGG